MNDDTEFVDPNQKTSTPGGNSVLTPRPQPTRESESFDRKSGFETPLAPISSRGKSRARKAESRVQWPEPSQTSRNTGENAKTPRAVTLGVSC